MSYLHYFETENIRIKTKTGQEFIMEDHCEGKIILKDKIGNSLVEIGGDGNEIIFKANIN